MYIVPFMNNSLFKYLQLSILILIFDIITSSLIVYNSFFLFDTHFVENKLKYAFNPLCQRYLNWMFLLYMCVWNFGTGTYVLMSRSTYTVYVCVRVCTCAYVCRCVCVCICVCLSMWYVGECI